MTTGVVAEDPATAVIGDPAAGADAQVTTGEVAEDPATAVTTRPDETGSGRPAPLPGAPPAPGDDCSFENTMTTIGDSVFQIILSSPEGPQFGTAFSVGDGDILTAAHLVAGRSDVRLRNASADFPATVTATDPERDLAILRAAEPRSADKGLPLRNSAEIQPGESVASVGYPLFEEYHPSIAGGLISRFTQDQELGLVIQTDAPINRGNSGGPLVDRCGNVVGMVVEKWFEEGVEGIGWAVASSSLEAALSDLRNGRAPASPSTASPPVDPSLPSIPTPSPSLGPAGVLDELAGAWEDFFEGIDVAGDDFVSGSIDDATLERVLWELAEGAYRYRSALDSAAYDLSGSGRSCDLARRGYARAIGWTSRFAGFRAAQVRSPGEYDTEVDEAIRKSLAIAQEAADHRDACIANR